MTEEEKLAIEKAKNEAAEAIKKQAQEAAKATAEELTKAVSSKVEEIEKKFSGLSTKEEIEKARADFMKEVAELQAQVKEIKQSGGDVKEKSFNEHLADAIEKSTDQIKEFASNKGGAPVTITMKAVGDMSIAANFPGATPWIQQAMPGLIWNPYNRVWLADILPQATSTANSIIYPKENGGEGAVAPWTDKTQDKPQLDFDFTSQTAFFKWLAGIVIIEREMLDDIAWLTSYLQQKMLISLKTAENSFVLNGTSDTNPVTGLLAAATAYDGTFTNFGEMIIDAAYGQIPTNTEDFYIPTNVILHPRDTVAIGLNKAAGSGEYDLPPNSITFGNGNLSIAGLSTVPTTSMTRNNFLAMDRNATMFLRRMNAEIRMFEDAALAKKNKVMFRIEERVSMAIFNNDAIVKGTYVPAV